MFVVLIKTNLNGNISICHDELEYCFTAKTVDVVHDSEVTHTIKLYGNKLLVVSSYMLSVEDEILVCAGEFGVKYPERRGFVIVKECELKVIE